MILKQYDDAAPETLAALNRLCVRLVFCLYAEDADIFPKNAFCNLVKSTPVEFLRRQLLRLFQTLDTPIEKRDRYLEPELAAFPYTNGGLFDGASESEIPPITEEIVKLLDGSSGFDWSGISPTIFGALFESTLNPETRRSGGMHYTSIENIYKLIDPLFLDDLTRRVDALLNVGMNGRSACPQAAASGALGITRPTKIIAVNNPDNVANVKVLPITNSNTQLGNKETPPPTHSSTHPLSLISQTAQSILDARAAYPDSSGMPPLRYFTTSKTSPDAALISSFDSV